MFSIKCITAWKTASTVDRMRPGVILIPIACLAFLLPACAVLLKYHESFANTLTFPGKSDTSLAYHQLISEFPAGKLSPQYVLIPAGPNATAAWRIDADCGSFQTDIKGAFRATSKVRSDEYFDFSCNIANALLQELSDSGLISGPSIFFFNWSSLSRNHNALHIPIKSSQWAILRWNLLVSKLQIFCHRLCFLSQYHLCPRVQMSSWNVCAGIPRPKMLWNLASVRSPGDHKRTTSASKNTCQASFRSHHGGSVADFAGGCGWILPGAVEQAGKLPGSTSSQCAVKEKHVVIRTDVAGSVFG